MKKTMNFCIAAIVAMGAILSGCTREEATEPELKPEQETRDKIVTVTTTIGLGENEATKALAVDYDAQILTKTFAPGDQVALFYEQEGSTDFAMALSNILTDSDIFAEGKSATLTFELVNPKENSSVSYYYPASLVDENAESIVSRIEYIVSQIKIQDGTLSGVASRDLSFYYGYMTGTTPPASVIMDNLFTIVAFTLKDETGTNDITSAITKMDINEGGAIKYNITGHDSDGHIYVIMTPAVNATFTITATDGTKIYTKTLTGKTWAANNFYQQGLRMTDSTPLTVEALTDGTVKVDINGTLSSGMKYSVNGGEKTLITTSTDIPVRAGDRVQFYGNGTDTQVYGSWHSEVAILGSGEGFKCKAYGNIMSLLDENNFATKTDLPDQQDVLSGLFRGNTALTDAGGLLLPATSLSMNCYALMFRDCTSLMTAPSLPSNTLAQQCYMSMFIGCTSLTTAPELPATTLASGCYAFMFEDCTALTTAPDLPATTLVPACYSKMFKGCSNLNSVKCLATSGINERYSTDSWLKGVATTGQFAAATDATWPENSESGIPSGWTRRNPDGSAISHGLASAVVGDIVGSDGKAYAATDKDFLPSGVIANCNGLTHAAAIATRSNNGTCAPTGCSDWFIPWWVSGS